MPTDVILPALGMSQDTGKIVRWLKAEGEHVVKGEPLVEIETDKATVEIEASADGVLARVSAAAGDDVPVGQVIASILSASEVAAQEAVSKNGASAAVAKEGMPRQEQGSLQANNMRPTHLMPPLEMIARPVTGASVLASRIAAERNVDLSLVKPVGRRIQKADVLTYLQKQEATIANTTKNASTIIAANASVNTITPRLVLASPRARRLAAAEGKDLATIKGSGPDGAVLAADVLAADVQAPLPLIIKETAAYIPQAEETIATTNGTSEQALSTIWRIMAERTTRSWTEVPHFYLMREVNASRLISWREQTMKQSAVKITYTDLLVKIVASALRLHPRVNASWSAGKISLQPEIHIGLAVAIEDGLVVPVIHRADTLSLSEIAQQRIELVAKAQAGKLRLPEISGGTFTISNLGMYNVDAFNAIINQPQAAILAVGRIAERVVPVNGQPVVRPMLVLTLSCDHRAVDGARGAQFLDTVANFIDEPLGLLV